jgi:hypothetical protein
MEGDLVDTLSVAALTLNGVRLGDGQSCLGNEYSIVSEIDTNEGWWLDIELPSGDSVYVLNGVIVGVDIESSVVSSGRQLIGGTAYDAMVAIGGDWSEEVLDAGDGCYRFFTSEDGLVVVAEINGLVTSVGLFVD